MMQYNSTLLSKHEFIVSCATFLVAFSLSACQSTPTAPVIQRENSVFETTGLGKTKVAAQQQALANADKTCRLKQPIVIKDETRYNGVLDAKTGRMVEQVGAVVGTIIGTGKPNLSRDDDYEYQITFRCQ